MVEVPWVPIWSEMQVPVAPGIPHPVGSASGRFRIQVGPHPGDSAFRRVRIRKNECGSTALLAK